VQDVAVVSLPEKRAIEKTDEFFGGKNRFTRDFFGRNEMNFSPKKCSLKTFLFWNQTV
jgi:hypothetical protein